MPTSTPKSRPFSNKTGRGRNKDRAITQPRLHNVHDLFSNEDDDNHFHLRDDDFVKRERRKRQRSAKDVDSATNSGTDAADIWMDEDSSELEESALSALRSAKWKMSPS